MSVMARWIVLKFIFIHILPLTLQVCEVFEYSDTYSIVSKLIRSNVSICARSNSSWYLSILRAFSQSWTVDTADRSVGVGLSSG